jgi:tetratricopeptide (TPR) repeat protein
MRRLNIAVVLAAALLVGCAAHHPAPQAKGTLADLHKVAPDVKEVKVEQGLDQAMQSYRQFLEKTPETAMTPEAMRRLADLQIEEQYGIHAGDKPKQMAAPEPGKAPSNPAAPATKAAAGSAGRGESDQEFERRTTALSKPAAQSDQTAAAAAEAIGTDAAPKGPTEAIAIYKRLLTEYPDYKNSDQVLYQMARAYDELGRSDEAMATMERLIQTNPHSEHYDEVQFRRGEYFFMRKKYRDAESAYSAIVTLGAHSSYYELALYKLGWTYYKQELYEEALRRYTALLDYKVSNGYNFDQKHEKEEERRVADTFRAVSLSFSNLGGADALQEYFHNFGNRPYEDRIYSNLGEHYLEKLRYDDAAKTYKAFIALYPYHRSAPLFSMRVIDTFTKGGFPKLVLDSKREFASKYGLQSEYWQHNKPADLPEVVGYLKTNLKDLATHYHAEYQNAQDPNEKLADYQEGLRWYGDYLKSFPTDAESPGINYRLADLHFENKDFGEAAKQYERTAYEYKPHSQSAAAGYAAVYAYRQELKAASKEQQEAVKRDTVRSSLKFANAFPDHPQAAAVLGAAADDLYEMKQYQPAVESAQRLIDKYPGAEMPIRRSAWIVVAHGSFELAQYPQAEKAYTQVLTVTPEGDASRTAFVENLAASIYKQGELARNAKDYRAAANNFLRIRTAAPTSTIRPTAEYDAGAALIELQDWKAAAEVLEAFRSTFPKDKMAGEATRLIARSYQESGQLSHAASEYDRLASESNDPAVRGQALLVAGDLYEKSKAPDHALDVYQRYVKEFPKPVETALETHFKISEIYKVSDQDLYHKELVEIVRIDAAAGSERTARTRTIAARSALVLAEQVYQDFVAIKLRQPFEASLKQKQERMDVTIETMTRLVDYEIAEVTAAATYYMGETYFDFSRSLKESERPSDLKAADVQKYEDGLDEAAYPFEDKAIKVHEKNMELLHAGVFNTWTEKSLGRLAELMPGRYAKNELNSGFPDAIDRYVYRPPASQIPAPTPGNATTPSKSDQTTQAAPTPGNATTPAKPDQTPGKSDQKTHSAPTPSNTTQGKSDQTMPPAPTANQGEVKHESPQ